MSVTMSPDSNTYAENNSQYDMQFSANGHVLVKC